MAQDIKRNNSIHLVQLLRLVNSLVAGWLRVAVESCGSACVQVSFSKSSCV